MQVFGLSLPPANEVCPGQVHPPPGRDTPQQVHPQAGTPLGRYAKPREGTPPGQVPPGRYTPPRQVHPRGQVPLAGTPPATVHAGIQSTSGHYASHLNAFLCKYLGSRYHLEIKFGKVMFSQVSVCPQGRVPGKVPPGQVHPAPGRYTPQQVHPPAGTPLGRYTTPGAGAPRQVHSS